MGEIEKMKQEDVEAITNRQENTTTSVNDSKDKKKQRKKLGKLDKLVIGVGGTIIATTLGSLGILLYKQAKYAVQTAYGVQIMPANDVGLFNTRFEAFFGKDQSRNTTAHLLDVVSSSYAEEYYKIESVTVIIKEGTNLYNSQLEENDYSTIEEYNNLANSIRTSKNLSYDIEGNYDIYGFLNQIIITAHN